MEKTVFKELTDETYQAAIAETEAGVLICFKQQCPHCKNMEKVLGKFASKKPEITLFALDSEQNPNALAELESERAPTIFVIKSGTIVARKGGLMNPKEMKAFFASA